jgi:hypothetical protein
VLSASHYGWWRKFTQSAVDFNAVLGSVLSNRLLLLAFITHLRVLASSFLRFRDRTHWHYTVGRTPLDEWSARRRDLYLTTHNTHNRQTSMPPADFEPAISAGKRLQTYALDRSATGIGLFYQIPIFISRLVVMKSGSLLSELFVCIVGCELRKTEN